MNLRLTHLWIGPKYQMLAQVALIIFFISTTMGCSTKREIAFDFFKSYSIEYNFESDGFYSWSIFWDEKSLNSTLNTSKIFNLVKDSLDMADFNFKEYDYVYSIGRPIGRIILSRNKDKNGQYFIPIVEYHAVNPNIVYFYRVAKSPKIGPGTG